MPLPQFTAVVDIVFTACGSWFALQFVWNILIGESGSGRVTDRAHIKAELQRSH